MKKYSEMTEAELMQDQRDWEAQTQKMDDEQKVFLSKFKDIDLLLNNAAAEVEYYFKRQNDFKTIDEFKRFLKEKLEVYANYFLNKKFDSDTGKPLIDMDSSSKLIRFEEAYNKIVYFGGINPIDERKKYFAKLEAEELKAKNKQQSIGMKLSLWFKKFF
jgi:hypothetical protein